MTYDELIEAVLNSDGDDWLQDDSHGIFTFKPDLNVTIRQVREEESQPFEAEEWATKFPDKHAYVAVFELYYGSSFVKDYHFASVDGHRARLPYPKSSTELTITPEKHAVAKAVDLLGTLDDYMARAGLSIAE